MPEIDYKTLSDKPYMAASVCHLCFSIMPGMEAVSCLLREVPRLSLSLQVHPAVPPASRVGGAAGGRRPVGRWRER